MYEVTRLSPPWCYEPAEHVFDSLEAAEVFSQEQSLIYDEDAVAVWAKDRDGEVCSLAYQGTIYRP
jgi:hypothetical protein